MAMRGKWIFGNPARRRHPVQLVCLPHAGGTASKYRSWLAALNDYVDVLPVQLPGRENRILEPLVTDLDELVGQITEAVMNAELPDIALFGHSMGAILATRVCQSLDRHDVPVRHLFVSGHPGPGNRISMGSPFAVTYAATDEALLDSVALLDASAREMLGDAELRAMFLGILRSDLRVVRNAPLDGIRVRAPITVFGGTDDPLLAGRNLANWATATTADLEVHRLPGEHFYLATQADAIAEVVCRRLGLHSGEVSVR
ncbi:thioesterase II family protein [Kibdelosporangium persicum]|uniref:Oleoyl-(Acyl-carrier-protein) hydrolase n=1 Tax=Kibdelosporangium persicum TaxID=2698649 RepID=A0ABX2FI83_9PSEU|nr:alpha/beta fold hydrolase [Kibdelosporangium persicum]NRN71106.1 Oleoyl-(Acyl-carrier-protein) hydrolase [Kibdelosporangium persicum]